MKVWIVQISDPWGATVVRKVFSSQEKTDRWLERFVREYWSVENWGDPCPEDGAEAVELYFRRISDSLSIYAEVVDYDDA